MKKWLWAQTIILLGGTVFAWFNVIRDFNRFYKFEGTIFKIQDCVIPSPFTQACFYGAIAFLLAFSLSVFILRAVEAKKQEKYLSWLLAGGTVFAWFNVSKEFIAFYSSKNHQAVGCSAVPITNPFLTSCFFGAFIFLIAATVVFIILHKQKNN